MSPYPVFIPIALQVSLDACKKFINTVSYCCCLVARLGVTLCDPINRSTPGFPVLHYLPEFAQTHAHWSIIPSKHLILCHPLLLFSSIFLSIRVFPWNQFFASGGQNIGTSASASVLLMNTQDWSPLGWTCWISLQSKGLSKVFFNTTVQKHQFFHAQLSSHSNSHSYMTTGKTIALTRWTFVGKLMSLLFNLLSRLVINFLPRSKLLFISWLKSPSAVILEPPKIKSDTVSIVSPSICHEVMGPDAMILVFWMLSFKPTFSLFFTFSNFFKLFKLFHFHQKTL